MSYYRSDSNTSHPNWNRQQNLNRNQQLNNSSMRHETQKPSANSGDNNYLAYRSYKYPEQIGFDELVQQKEVLQQLLNDFKDKKGRITFQPYKAEEYSKRLMLLQQQIDGIMRQSYLYGGQNTAQRTLDYSALLMEKQNQVNQLERKIAHLQSQLRMRDQRQVELEGQLERRFASIKSKNDQIQKLRGSKPSYTNQNSNSNQVVNSLTKKLMLTLEDLLRRGSIQPAQLQHQIQSWILSLPNQSALKKKYREADQNWLQNKYKKYLSYVTTEAASLVNSVNKLYMSQITNIKTKSAPVDYDPKIMELIGRQVVPSQFLPSEDVVMKSQIMSGFDNRPLLTSTSPIRSGYYNNVSRVSVQVPVQDTKTKALIHKLASQMRRLYTKYPKLASEISPELSQFFSQQILDVIQVDELDRLVEIVKYKPDIVKVENVYAFNSEKNRRVEFHLKVLIKALLEEMEKMKIKTGVMPEIDEGVIGMIRAEIMDVVDVDDILKVYRVVPKIVEVEKVVEQVVEKIVPVPHFVTIERNITQPIPVNTVSVVKDTVNIPLQIPKVQTLVRQKLVLGNQFDQRVVLQPALQQNPYEIVREVPTVRNVQKVVGLPQQVIQTVEIPGAQKIIPVEREIIKQLIQQKIVPVERIVQKIVQVQRIVQKIVPVIQEVPKIIEVQRIVEKAVPMVQHVESLKVQNYVVEKPVQVICYVQKIVPVQRIIQKIVTYPEIVEKIVPVISVQEVLKEVQIIREVPIFQKQLIVQDRFIDVPTPSIIHEVPKVVDQIVEVPFIHEKVRVETEYRKQPYIQREERLIREPVNIEVPVILYQQKVTQVQKPFVQFIKQEIPRELVRQKIVPIQTVRDQLIPTPFIVQKVIEKLVEVPRIIQIEKIVQKIVPVPRVVEKIVQVEKIIQKIVQKNIYHTNIQPIQYLHEIPIQVEKVITIQIPQYIVSTKEVPQFVDRPVPVVSEVRTESVRVEQLEQPPRVTVERMEVPIEIIREKVAPMVVQDHVYVQLKQQIVVPMEVPVPTTLIEQKLVPVEQIVPVVQPVDRIIERIIEVQKEMPGRIEVQDRVVEKLVTQNQVKVVRDEIPYYNESIKQIQTVMEKIVPVDRVVREVLEVPYMVEKLVNQIIQVPNVYEVQRVVQVPVREQQLITVDRIVPKIVTLNKAFAHIVDKLHEFPRLAEEMKQVERRIDNLVIQKHGTTDIINSEIMVEKAVIQEKLREVDKYINVVNESLNVVDRIIEKPTDPIIITQQKILQVPVIVEKLAERIVIMPQVVEVLKYIHEITDNENLGVAVSADIGVEQAEYKRLGKNVNKELINLRNILMDLKRNPQYRNQVDIIDTFLSEFNKFLAYPRIRQIMTEKLVPNTVEKDRIVKVATRTAEDERRNLASAVLIDKLLMELKKVKLNNPNVKMQLDQDIMHLFGDQLDPISQKYGNNYNQLLDEYSKAIYSKFNSYGTFTLDHQRMLREFIEERFQLANRLKKTSKDSAKYKQLYNGTNEKYNREVMQNQLIRSKFNDLDIYNRNLLLTIVDISTRRSLEEKLNALGQAISGFYSGADTPTYTLKDMSELDKDRANRYLREKESLIIDLRRTIETLKRQLQVKGRQESVGQLVYGNCNIHTNIIGDLQRQVEQLRRYKQIHTNTQTNTVTSKTIISEDHSRCQAQINRLNAELNKYKEELNRLRLIEDTHRKCNNTVDTLQRKIIILEEEITKYKREITSVASKEKESKHTASGSGYGRNFMEYVDLKDSSEHDHSINSDTNRGVYRSTGNYPDTYSRGDNGASLGYIPQHSSNQLGDSRRSGDIYLNKNRPLFQSGYQRENQTSRSSARAQSRDLISNQYQSKVESSEGGSSGLYGNSPREIIKRNYRDQR